MRNKNKKPTDITDILIKTQLFRGVPKEKLDQLVQQNFSAIKHFPKGSRVIGTGDDIDFVSVVLEGMIIVNRLGKDGSLSTVHVLKERKTVGLEFLETKHTKSQLDYTALTDVTLFCIDKKFFETEGFEEALIRQILVNIIRLMTHENLRQNQKLHILSMGTIRKKLITFLYYEYEKCNCREFDISFNRETLAAYLCVNRSALSRELSQMEEEGLVRTKGKHFLILDDMILNQDYK